jgi:DNA-binding transcriptional LysR family regulator
MELRHIRYFLAVASEANMRRAAAKLGVAQPSLSRQIADIEEEIGFKLFDRLPRGIRLSSAGAAFRMEGQKVLACVDAAVAAAQRTAKGEGGTLQISFVDAASWQGAFPNTIHKYRARFPEVNLQLLPMSSRDQIQSINLGEVDGGFCYGLETIPEGCETIHLRSDKVLLGVPRSYHWKNRRDLCLAALVNEPFLWYRRADAPRYHDALLQAITSKGLSPRVVQEVTNGNTMLSLISAGIGLGFVNSALQCRKPSYVDLLAVKDLGLELPLFFVWRQNNNSVTLRHFIGTLQADERN